MILYSFGMCFLYRFLIGQSESRRCHSWLLGSLHHVRRLYLELRLWLIVNNLFLFALTPIYSDFQNPPKSFCFNQVARNSVEFQLSDLWGHKLFSHLNHLEFGLVSAPLTSFLLAASNLCSELDVKPMSSKHPSSFATLTYLGHQQIASSSFFLPLTYSLQLSTWAFYCKPIKAFQAVSVILVQGCSDGRHWKSFPWQNSPISAILSSWAQTSSFIEIRLSSCQFVSSIP